MTRPFGTVAVLGLGTTGSALAAMLAAHGLRVDTVERDSDALWHGRTRVKAALAGLGLAEADRAEADQRVSYSTSMVLLPRADLVIEAVPERLSRKVTVLRQADALCPAATVFATTTSGLSVTEIASRGGRMARTIGLHLCHPTRLTNGRAVEVVLTPITDASVRRDTTEFVARLGKTAVCVPDLPGLVGAGLFLGYLNDAATMYEQNHASCRDIDTAMTHGAGLPVGPFAQLDNLGLDVVLDSLHALAERTGDGRYTPARVLHQLVDAGLLGRKSGRGFYRYDTPDGGPGPAEEHPITGGRPVHTVGVVGSGAMAAGVAEVFARAGYSTIVAARTDARARATIASVAASTADPEVVLARLSGAGELAVLADCDLVVEAVAEDLLIKQGVFTELDKLTRADTVLASTTASLPVIQLATATSRPETVLGLHFCHPAPATRLVEVAHTLLTAEDVVATALTVVRSLGRRAVRCADRTGLIVNALLFPYLNRAVRLTQQRTVDVDTIDTVLTDGYGFPAGPFQLLDTVGLDVSLAIQRRLHDTYRSADLAPAKYLSDLVAAGYLGRRTGRGFRRTNA